MLENTDGISKHTLSPYTSTIYITNITFYLMFPVPTVIYFFCFKIQSTSSFEQLFLQKKQYWLLGFVHGLTYSDFRPTFQNQ